MTDPTAGFREDFDRRFARYLGEADAPAELAEAVRYTALAPGKRVRPYLVMRCCELVGGARDAAWPVAAAVECVHAFSLVHDDLPAMDDDDLRRGRPTTHRKFGEALAILAGDALVVLAFELIARHVADAAAARDMILTLATHTGWAGMIGGQSADVLAEGQPPSLSQTEFIHVRKTARLFEAACRMGAIVGGGASDDIERLTRFGGHLGRAFQIADDLLDVTATADGLGKAVAKDAPAGKQTYPRCVGVESSRAEAIKAVEDAVKELHPWAAQADDLRSLARFVIDRSF